MWWQGGAGTSQALGDFSWPLNQQVWGVGLCCAAMESLNNLFLRGPSEVTLSPGQAVFPGLV